mmetsp:Transcript_19729/g.40048  ORF Transcript_19729/g.40048 Transcript_19729/m.40048 type:complete len:106 (-) Transcript_19729:815-1132(-)
MSFCVPLFHVEVQAVTQKVSVARAKSDQSLRVSFLESIGRRDSTNERKEIHRSTGSEAGMKQGIVHVGCFILRSLLSPEEHERTITVNRRLIASACLYDRTWKAK